jgi:hypothetical protein
MLRRMVPQRRVRPAIWLCAWLLALTSQIAPAAATEQPRRVALVIGNGAYQSADTPKLSNPANDADDVGAALRRFGFSVTVKKNVGREAMNDAIAEFGRKAADADAALFYFAGHGVQIRNQNYLIPVDAKVRSEAGLANESVGMTYVLDELDNAHSRVNIVILDACRDNPINGKFRGAGARGLAAPSGVPKATVIVYATDPGNTAEDGEGRNGLFTSGLLAAFRQKDLSLDGVLTSASAQVEKSSGGRQTPYVDGPKLVQKNFFFDAPQAAAPAPAAGADAAAIHVPTADEIETELWDTIKNSQDPSDFQNYLAQYPNGRFVVLARQHVKELHAGSGPAAALDAARPDQHDSLRERPAGPVEAPRERPAELRFAVAEKRSFSWCYGYLNVTPETVRYEVVQPKSCEGSAFEARRSEVDARQWTVLGMPQAGIEIRVAGETRVLQWLVHEREVRSGDAFRLSPPRAQPPDRLLSALHGAAFAHRSTALPAPTVPLSAAVASGAGESAAEPSGLLLAGPVGPVRFNAGIGYVAPAGWSISENGGMVVMSRPMSQNDSPCVALLLPPQPAQADLVAQAYAIANQLFAARFGRLAGDLGRDIRLSLYQGISGKGWDYIELFGILGDERHRNDGRILLAQMGSQVVALAGITKSGQCLGNRYYRDNDNWALLFHSLQLPGYTGDSPLLKQQLLGQWESVGSTTFSSKTYAANGHFGRLDAHATYTESSRPGFIVQETSSWEGDGSYEVRGDRLTSSPSTGEYAGKTITELFSIVRRANTAKPGGSELLLRVVSRASGPTQGMSGNGAFVYTMVKAQ